MIPQWRLVREWKVNGIQHRELVNQITGQRCVAVDFEMLRKSMEPEPFFLPVKRKHRRHRRRR